MYNRLYTVTGRFTSLWYLERKSGIGSTEKDRLWGRKNMPLPQVPIYFFMGGKFEVPLDRRRKDYDHQAFFIERTHVNIERWRRFTYSSSKGGSLLYLSNSSHFIHRDDAKAVTANIKLLLGYVSGK